MPPAAPHGDLWTPVLPRPMASAYVMANGIEPESNPNPNPNPDPNPNPNPNPDPDPDPDPN